MISEDLFKEANRKYKYLSYKLNGTSDVSEVFDK